MKAAGRRAATVGFRLLERAGVGPARLRGAGRRRAVGVVTSGAPSPTLGENIGLALVDREAAGVGKPLEIVIRGRPVPAVQIKTPFYRRPDAALSDEGAIMREEDYEWLRRRICGTPKRMNGCAATATWRRSASPIMRKANWATSPIWNCRTSASDVSATEPFGVVESVKAASDVYAPVDGEVIERNEEVIASPDLINSSPYDRAWLVKLRVADPEQIEQLMAPTEYDAFAEATGH